MSGSIKEKEASMRKEEEYSNSSHSIITVAEHLAYLFAISILVVLPLTATIYKGFDGAIVSGIIILFTSPVTVQIFRSVKTVSFPRFLQATRQLLNTKLFRLILISVFNVWMLLTVGLQTMIPLYSLLTLFLTSIAIGFFFTQYGLKGKVRKQSLLISMGLIPLLLNLFFLINFIFSHSPSTQTYQF
jgi:hypothetical protein